MPKWNAAEDFRGGMARVHVGGEFVHVMDAPSYWMGGAWHYVNAEGDMVGVCHADGEAAAEMFT